MEYTRGMVGINATLLRGGIRVGDDELGNRGSQALASIKREENIVINDDGEILYVPFHSIVKAVATTEEETLTKSDPYGCGSELTCTVHEIVSIERDSGSAPLTYVRAEGSTVPKVGQKITISLNGFTETKTIVSVIEGGGHIIGSTQEDASEPSQLFANEFMVMPYGNIQVIIAHDFGSTTVEPGSILTICE